MRLKYKIIEVIPEQHSIVVRYYTDAVSEEHLCSHRDAEGNPIRNEDGSIQRCRSDNNICLWEVPPITGDALTARIVSCAPDLLLALEANILDPGVDTSLSEITSLVGAEVESDSTIPVTEL